MLKCLLIKRKLYDYLNHNLSDIDKIKVGRHLDSCDKCKVRLNRMKSILDLALQKEAPQPTDEFWHSFRVDLDRKLNAQLVSPLTFERKLGYRLRPVFAYTLVLIFVLTMGIYFSKKTPTSYIFAQKDDTLVDEIVMLDELSEGAELNHNEEFYIEEINLIYQLEPTAS